MENRYDPKDVERWVRTLSAYPEALARRVYTSRLIGSDPKLVLHGGGNTSVKCRIKNILGETEEVLYVKGSGRDLAEIGPEGFAGLRLEPLRNLRRLDALSDADMENQLAIHRTAADSPNPSVEALLHAFLPHTFVDHTHADGILILSNIENGENILKEALGKRLSILPYVMSGFPLACAVVKAFERAPDVEAVVVMHHGIFTFGDTAETAYGNMIRYVTAAEAHIAEQTRGKTALRPNPGLSPPRDRELAMTRTVPVIRGACARSAGDGPLRRVYVEARTTADMIEASLSTSAGALCRTGVLTPDHVIRTKHRLAYIDGVPEDDETLKEKVTGAVEHFTRDYLETYEKVKAEKGWTRSALDPFPRVFLVAGIGMIAVGETRSAARISADIGERTLCAKTQAFALGNYVPITDAHVFDMEYWGFQQKKLHSDPALPLQGQVALITGGAGAIGFGIAERLLSAGAAVALSDIDRPRLEKICLLLAEQYEPSRIEPVTCDVTDFVSVQKACGEIVRKFGGIDILVPNAGIAHVARIENLNPDDLDRVIAVNLKGTFTAIKASVPIFRRQGTGGHIVLISSKNVFDPGAAFGAYSASKAGAHQIAKIAAIELAELGVRVNMINPDAVFGDEKVSSKLWDEIGPDRMRSRGLDAEGLRAYYRQRSLLKVPVLGRHVGNAVVFFASDLTPTTGASLPVDAGNPGAFPR